MIVLDASAAVSALLNDGQARRLVATETIHVPHLVDTEVVSAMRRQVLAGVLTAEDAHHAMDVWRQLGPLRRPAAAGTRVGTTRHRNSK